MLLAKLTLILNIAHDLEKIFDILNIDPLDLWLAVYVYINISRILPYKIVHRSTLVTEIKLPV